MSPLHVPSAANSITHVNERCPPVNASHKATTARVSSLNLSLDSALDITTPLIKTPTTHHIPHEFHPTTSTPPSTSTWPNTLNKPSTTTDPLSRVSWSRRPEQHTTKTSTASRSSRRIEPSSMLSTSATTMTKMAMTMAETSTGHHPSVDECPADRAQVREA